MNNKVFVVTEEFANPKEYANHYGSTNVIAVASTKEEAEKIVDDIHSEIMSMKAYSFGQVLIDELRSGTYSYCIEEFELGKVQKYEEES